MPPSSSPPIHGHLFVCASSISSPGPSPRPSPVQSQLLQLLARISMNHSQFHQLRETPCHVSLSVTLTVRWAAPQPGFLPRLVGHHWKSQGKLDRAHDATDTLLAPPSPLTDNRSGHREVLFEEDGCRGDRESETTGYHDNNNQKNLRRWCPPEKKPKVWRRNNSDGEQDENERQCAQETDVPTSTDTDRLSAFRRSRTEPRRLGSPASS